MSPSEPEGEASRAEEPSTVSRPRELGAYADVPDNPRRELEPDTDFGARSRGLASVPSLFREHVAYKRRAREAGGAHWVAEAKRELVPLVPLIVPGCRQELVPGVQVQAQLVEGLRHDALQLNRVPTSVNAGRQTEAQLDAERGQSERLLIQVVER